MALFLRSAVAVGLAVLGSGSLMSRMRPASMIAGQQMLGGPAAVENPIAICSADVSPGNVAPPEWTGDLLVVSFWEAEKDSELSLDATQAAVDSAYGGALSDVIADHDFKGKAGSSAVIALPRGLPTRRLAVVGLGKADSKPAAGFGEALATAAMAQKAKVMAAVLPSEPELTEAQQATVVEAALLGLSPDKRYKSDAEDDDNKPPPLTKLELLGGASVSAIARGTTMAAGILVTRGLVASPPNYLTPATMAETAAGLAEKFPSLTLKVLEQDECAAMGMGAYLGVSQGACNPPKFIHLTYSPPSGAAAKKVALVGKGLTFDSGGYNIKAGAGSMIEKMKFDMGGAGAVLGAARSIAELTPPGIEVHFIIAACENMVSAEAFRPGDILTASNGKTIEVLNTDAEGRLTLADALVYADRIGKVDAIVDIATLTGACIVALGPDYGAVYCDDDELLNNLQESASSSGELLWRMPLAPEYTKQIKSSIADIANLGAPGGGGSITAALFLKEFVKKESPDAHWAHMDIAGPVWNDKKGGATGYGVRTLVGLIEKMSA